MRRSRMSFWMRLGVALAAVFGAAPPLAALASAVSFHSGQVNELSASCGGQNAEVEQAADRRLGYVYEDWMGCHGIGFARSTDGGRTFQEPIALPGTVGSTRNAWDPALAVASDGTVYAAFMRAKDNQWFPVVAASFDHGATFPQVSYLVPPDPRNWGDRDFLAVGPDGTVYLTYDYGPNRTSVTFVCASNGSCGFSTGDVNAVMQKSTDRGRTWSGMYHVSPGFPASGGDSAPLLVEKNGRIDVLYQGYDITNKTTYTMGPGYEYFTSSTDGGATWTPPVKVGGEAGSMSVWEWWIDGDLAIDAGANLYASWDTQGTNADGSANDVGWLAYSTNHGATWSRAIQATPDRLNVPHIMTVAGGAPGVAYLGSLSSSDPRGYAQYLRAFSIGGGWLTGQYRVSTRFGDTSVWPGDTTGLSALDATHLVLSWGSAYPAATGKQSQIWAAAVAVAGS